MKFIHAADIHLDSPLTGLSAYGDAPVELLRSATRNAFSNLVSEAIDESVDFVVIAGDLYDGSWKDYNTGIYFSREMGRLNAVGIPVYLIYGNHDAESDTTKKLLLPANVHAFGASKPHTFRIPELKVALHGQSFKHAATTINLASGYPAPEPGWLNIGVLHTALEGYAEHASYAPCSIAELSAKGYLQAPTIAPMFSPEQRIDIFSKAVEPTLQRELKHKGAANGDGSYYAELIGYVEIVAEGET